MFSPFFNRWALGPVDAAALARSAGTWVLDVRYPACEAEEDIAGAVHILPVARHDRSTGVQIWKKRFDK